MQTERNFFGKLALILQVLRLKIKFVFAVICWASTVLPEEIILVIKEWGEGLGAQVSRDTVIQMKKKKEDEEEGTEKELLCMQCRSLVDA